MEPPCAHLLSRPIYLAVRVRILFIDAAALTYLLDYPAYCQVGKEVSNLCGQNYQDFLAKISVRLKEIFLICKKLFIQWDKE